MNRILDNINSPRDLKSLSLQELTRLCDEIREQMIIRSSVTGGHVGSNLGMIEATVALHYVFNSPIDKIVFDVSHQCYTHKLLTGRRSAYTVVSEYGTVSGFTNPEESEHDIFSIGHTSTAISLACGLAKARDLRGESSNIIAVSGDGALSGGEAFEGLNNAAVLESNIIILINDNNMSIAENHGGIYKNLELLRSTDGKAECNIFRALGFEYKFISDGNNLVEVVKILSEVKNTERPVVVHMCTEKGRGYRFSENDKEKWHYMPPFDIASGEPNYKADASETYENLTRDFLIKKMSENSDIVAVTAGTPKILGFDKKLREQYSNQFTDVGIAEEHAVAYISGIAKNGSKPVFGVSSTFLPRTYDQLSHDLALNKSPAVILVFFAGISCGSQTHMGVFDIPLIMSIPNVIYLAPTCREEYIDMLEWSIEQSSYPVIIRIPEIYTSSRNVKLLHEYNFPAKYEIVKQGNDVAVLALGGFFELGLKITEKLKTEHEINAALINPRYINSLDEKMLKSLADNKFKLIVTLEDGVLDGGFGEAIAGFYGKTHIKILNFGAKKEFVNHISALEQYRKYHLTVEQIAADILAEL